MKILLTNDDGINAPGIYALTQEMKKIGEVIIVAPETEQSAVGHAITLSSPLRVKKVFHGIKFFGYAVDGTPADCVKVAVRAFLKKVPDIVVSGINLGPNLGTDVIYSGTVSAATEATVLGIPSIAVSLATYKHPDFSGAANIARIIASLVLKQGLPYGTLLNVNVPACPQKQIKGITITRQGKSVYKEMFVKREDPKGRTYYWLTGKASWLKENGATDIQAIREHKVSVTPIHFDMTDYEYLKQIKNLKIKLK